MKRRAFVATATTLGTALVAGCSGGSDGGDGGSGGDGGGDGSGDDGTDGSDGSAERGTFRLLISDQPAAIDEFASLDVTLSSARVFRADKDEEDTASTVVGTPAEETDGTDQPETEETADEDEPEEPGEGVTADEETEGEDEEDEDGDDKSNEDGEGFVEFELEDVTVDLTQVVGDRAIPVLEGELEAGRYSGIELRVESAEGVVDGETVDVMVPSSRLRLVRPFEVASDTELSFVFDIKVVKRGASGGYNLLPVIGKSGVAGEDVDVEEVEEEDGEEGEDDRDGGGGDEEEEEEDGTAPAPTETED